MHVSKVDSAFFVISSGKVEEIASILKDGKFLARVLELVKPGSYRLSIQGKLLLVESRSRLFEGELVHLDYSTKENNIELRILQRTYSSSHQNKAGNYDSLKYNIFEMIRSVTRSTGETRQEQVILQYLQTVFPEMEWQENTPFFSWKFEDSEAQGFLGEKDDTGIFYLFYESKRIGTLGVLTRWKKDDVRSLSIRFSFSWLASYVQAVDNYQFLLGTLVSAGFSSKQVFIHYEPSVATINREWKV
jgi:hypothetical protein